MLEDVIARLLALDAVGLATIAVLTFVGSVAAGLSGMGAGILVAIAITPIVGVKALVPTLAVTMTVNHVARVWAFRRDVHWRPVVAVLASAVPLTVAGSLVYVRLPTDAIALVMGVFLIAFVPVRRALARRAWRVGPGGLAGVGAVYGFLAGTTLGGGMLIPPVLLGSGLAGAALVGSDAAIGLTVLVTKVIAFGRLDLLTTDLVVIGLLVGVVSIPGVFLARWMLRRTSVHLHTVFIEIVIVGGGVSFLWRGLAPG